MRMLLENPSAYIAFGNSTMTEIEFLRAVAQRTGCGLLLDVNNVHVSAINHGSDAAAYIDSFPMQHVGEFHLAGFAEDRDSSGARLLIDDHGCLSAMSCGSFTAKHCPAVSRRPWSSGTTTCQYSPCSPPRWSAPAG